MRFFKILIFAVIVTALFVGAYWLIVRPTGTGTGSFGQGGLRQMCIERIKVYGDSIGSRGWSDDYLSAARVLISGHRHALPANEVRQLDNTLQSVFIEKIDTLIRSFYGRDMTSGDLSSLTKLNKAYQGLDKLAAAYPAIRSSQRWVALDRLRKTHKEIYEFGKRSFSLKSKFNLRLKKVGPDVLLLVHDPVVDFDEYQRSMFNMCASLASRCSQIVELESSPWTRDALNTNKLTIKLRDARTSYINRENHNVSIIAGGFVANVNSKFGDRLSVDAAEHLVKQIEMKINYLNSKGINAEPLTRAKNQIDRIYIKDRNI